MPIRRLLGTIALAAGMLLVTALPALADDIGRFDVAIDVAPNGSMTVTETIDYTSTAPTATGSSATSPRSAGTTTGSTA